jgi:hypothetical protein
MTLVLLLTSAPAWAAKQSATVPEGSQLTLFALGVLGVIIGRRASMKRRADRD